MSKYSPHAHIAGEVVASGSRPANEVADRIIARLASDGYRIVPDGQVGPMQIVIDLSGEEPARKFLEAVRAAAALPLPADRAA